MDPVCYYIVILLILSIPISEGEFYHFINQQKTWNEAREYCEDHNGTLAFGDVDNYKNRVPSGDSAYIGTVLVESWIWMAGCYRAAKIEDLHDIRNGRGLKQTWKLSFSKCMVTCYQYKYIVVEERRNQEITQYSCYCLNSTDSLERHNSSSCVVCNDVRKYCGFNNSLSLYQLDHGQTVLHEKRPPTTLCGSVLLKNSVFYYEGRHCSERLHVVHQKYYENFTVYSNDYAKRTWNEALNQRPNSEDSLLQKNDLKEDALKDTFKRENITKLWFGLFQTEEKVSVTEIVEGMKYTCGLYTHSKTEFRNCDGMRSNFVCQTSDSNTSLEFTVVDLVTSDTTAVTTVTHNGKEQTSSSHTLLVACFVGGGGGLIIVLIAIGVGCYIAKRRRMNHRPTVQTNGQEKEHASAEPFIQNQNPEHSEKAQSRNAAANDGEYDVFCKRGLRGNIAGPTEDLYDHTRIPSDENSYDCTSNVQKVMAVDDTYDHTRAPVVQKGMAVDDTYDHTRAPAVQKGLAVDGTYDHTQNLQVTKRGAGTTDDYDHVEISRATGRNQ